MKQFRLLLAALLGLFHDDDDSEQKELLRSASAISY